jgi:PAS domain S-box-containing protein
MSLGSKLTLWLLLPVLCILSILAAVVLRREGETHQLWMAGESERLANVLAVLVTDDLARGQRPDLVRLARQAGLDDTRFGLALYDGRGQGVSAWGLIGPGGTLGPQESSALLAAGRGTGQSEEFSGTAVRSHLVALTRDGRLLGGLKIAQSLRESHELLARERNTFLGMLATVAFLLILLISFTIRQAVGQPLHRLMDHIAALALGKTPAPTPVTGADEVAQLSREFDALAQNLMEAREQLLRERDYAQNVIQSITEGIIGLDAEGRIRTWNRALADRYGIPEVDVLGQPLFAAFPALEREGLREEIDRLLRGEAREFLRRHFEHETRHRGRAVLNIRGTALGGSAGEIAGAVLAVEDVTDRVALAQEVQQAEKLAVVGQLAAGIAHQIGTPLNVISGSAEYLMMEWGAAQARPQELDIIVSQTDRITKLIRQLLNFARPARLELRELHLNDLLREVLALTEHQIAKEKIAIQAELQPDLPPLTGDANQLEQAFLNIIINAWHAMPDGGTLRLATRLLPTGERPRRAGRAPAPGIEVTISDTGTGIAAEHLGLIFDPFFSTKGVGKGTGLGLAISRRIVDDHHGVIEVESAVGRGTTFTIWLPIGGRAA